MTSYNVPPTLAAAKKELGALGSLLTATQWERSAVVYAFARDGRVADFGNSKLSTRDFAALSLQGLRKPETVSFYIKQWERAMKHGTPAAAPGKRVRLPDLDWRDAEDPDYAKAAAQSGRDKSYVEKDEAAVGRSVARQELDAEVLAQNLTDRDAEAVVARIMEDRPKIAQRAVAREQARELPEAPFTTPPIVGSADEYGRATNAMDDNSAIARLGNAVFAFGRYAQGLRFGTKRAEHLAARANEQYETLGAVIDALNGMSDEDLTALLSGGES